ncbi:MAG: amidohydrolase [Gammaproteobacteria bacterium]|nr:amidohydrolase [Gammaproteobacteria bacterium]
MPHFLSDDELQRIKHAQSSAFRSPVPTQIISNGEFSPLPQSPEQKQVEGRIKELADIQAKRQGMSRRRFLGTAAGMATAFMAMNEVFGPVFNVNQAEAAEPDRADARAASLRDQFILDDQTHFVHDGFAHEELLGLGLFAAENWNPAMDKSKLSLASFKFENYVREIFLNSDTKVALLSGAPFDDPSWWLLPNEQIREAVDMINRVAGGRRMLGHFVITPRQDGWLDKVDQAIETMPPDSWKGYTIGDPLSATTRYPWRLDDEKLMYPFYEKAIKAGINTLCIHKGLMPADYKESWKGVWEHNTHVDIAKAAKDWPQMNFVIYHGCLRPFLEKPDQTLAEFEETGNIDWSTQLAQIPAEHGVSNVYAELGTSFATCATANPRLAAALVGTFIKGMGADHVVWGTDSVWYGSPQWQIEALRRLEIPDDMQAKHGFAPLGPAKGVVKSAIFGYNSANLYNVSPSAFANPLEEDKLAVLEREYRANGGFRNNATYGYVA